MCKFLKSGILIRVVENCHYSFLTPPAFCENVNILFLPRRELVFVKNGKTHFLDFAIWTVATESTHLCLLCHGNTVELFDSSDFFKFHCVLLPLKDRRLNERGYFNCLAIGSISSCGIDMSPIRLKISAPIP